MYGSMFYISPFVEVVFYTPGSRHPIVPGPRAGLLASGSGNLVPVKLGLATRLVGRRKHVI